MAAQEFSPNDLTERFTPLKLSSGRVHPFLLYGTGFKGDQTGHLAKLALKNGFEGLDSANYPTAYNEVLVGDAVQEALKSGVKRKDILIQTKFTPSWAHAEGKLPYNTDQPLEQQVRESIEQSFKNLKVDHIDILLLHVPFKDEEDNLVAWKVFESFVPERISVLGVSNFPLAAFEKLYDAAAVKPEIVQNRFHEKNGYDIGLRAFLAQKGVIYQGFFLLKANTEARAANVVTRFAKQFEVQDEVAFYLLVLGLGKVSIVNGTTNEEHMRTDVEKVEKLLGDQKTAFAIKSYLGEFEGLLQKIAEQRI
ncbi:hypothetical protein G7Y89_g2871 [Cudoniella acicularis]|uniref:NADP-dependent oxidoreductase domain-containing protein n=1 Tax=Cudoniella acicularis TaxID=354080 RepID=A0A8H4RTP3_9HELO|nr:hypothetical protein G7Y89_g2871 [Cudoniella acicularis]